MIADYVNLLQGTDSCIHFSTGNTLPLVAAPYGMNHWTVENADDPWFFSPCSRNFRGIRCTHQPSPWIQDYGTFSVIPQTGNRLCAPEARSGVYSPESMKFSPAGFSLNFARFQIGIELAATSRAAFLRFTFPGNQLARRLIFDLKDPLGNWKACSDRLFAGTAGNHHGGVPENFRCHIAAELSCPADFIGENGIISLELSGPDRVVELRLATSFISEEQAFHNLGELCESLEDTRGKTALLWEEKLTRIRPECDAEQLRTFYSCFYRTMLFPREFHEFSADGSMIHYSPYDGKIHAGPLYADNGFWDTHRTVYPLLSILDPSRYGQILAGWLNAAREGGWFPRWSSPGYRSCMTGTHIDAVFADAAVKGIGGFDLAEAYSFLLKNAYEPVGEEGLWGRRALTDYLTLGFVPDDRCEHAAARTMDYAANDFALARIAAILGDEQRRRDLLRRSGNYRNLWNPAAGILQGRNADGSFPVIDPVDWNRTYIEGSSWQCGMAVPHDPAGLIALFGGPEATAAWLDAMLAAPPEFKVGAYGKEIHEMAEMALAGFGQYAHSNQPVHHLLWLYTLCGRRARGAEIIRRVAETLYTPDSLPGDEDNGEMSAWYIFATLGFYPFSPGRAHYVLSEPLCPVELTLFNGRIRRLFPGVFRGEWLSHRELCFTAPSGETALH